MDLHKHPREPHIRRVRAVPAAAELLAGREHLGHLIHTRHHHTLADLVAAGVNSNALFVLTEFLVRRSGESEDSANVS